ncbi:MAG: hypothetical protein V8Q57_08825 [Blautia sp.]
MDLNQELADYFNSMPWYQNTISPEVFDQGTLPGYCTENCRSNAYGREENGDVY